MTAISNVSGSFYPALLYNSRKECMYYKLSCDQLCQFVPVQRSNIMFHKSPALFTGKHYVTWSVLNFSKGTTEYPYVQNTVGWLPYSCAEEILGTKRDTELNLLYKLGCNRQFWAYPVDFLYFSVYDQNYLAQVFYTYFEICKFRT